MFSIRPVQPHDVSRILELAEELNLSPWTSKDYIGELARDDSIVFKLVTDQGEVVGFLAARIVASSDHAGSDAELYNIGVTTRLQSKGYGKKLLQFLISRCLERKAVNIWLEVRVSNESAIRFYQRSEFEIAAKRRLFYRDPAEDAYVMKLHLSDKT